ncbi:unnamed protein product, partial [Ectocarpus sp. 12 AP-2014]
PPYCVASYTPRATTAKTAFASSAVVQHLLPCLCPICPEKPTGSSDRYPRRRHRIRKTTTRAPSCAAPFRHAAAISPQPQLAGGRASAISHRRFSRFLLPSKWLTGDSRNPCTH